MPSQKIESGHQDTVHDVAMDYYGKRLATACADNTIKIIGISNSTSQPLATLSGHQGPVWQGAWAHPKSACGFSDGNISIYTARSDDGLDTSYIDQAHPAGVTSVSWAPSMALGALVGSDPLDIVQKLASGGCDNTVKVWKLSNGFWKMDCFPALQMHTNWVRDVAWAPNLGLPKSTIASASQDGRVIIWTVQTEGDQWNGKVLKDFQTPVWRVSWSLTGNILVVADGNNNVTLWNEVIDGEWVQVTTTDP
ncbi:hypothetical protein Vadar_008114 [Vaccinium darrowii]|uniref:Uncharacterized protein n=1 Tax=Vaccinium darrowii TaxID=229202 RepID=A0ACB7WYQ1_9ERIC|nr:hypothetical protein Vadar_008114 [Vaccinium darrowii]